MPLNIDWKEIKQLESRMHENASIMHTNLLQEQGFYRQKLIDIRTYRKEYGFGAFHQEVPYVLRQLRYLRQRIHFVRMWGI